MILSYELWFDEIPNGNRCCQEKPPKVTKKKAKPEGEGAEEQEPGKITVAMPLNVLFSFDIKLRQKSLQI